MSAAPKIQALVAAAASAIPKPSKDEAAVQAWVEKAKEEKLEDVQTLEKKITPLTYLFNQELTVADVATYASLHPTFASAPSAIYYQTPALTRYLNHIQNHPALSTVIPHSTDFPPITFDLSNMPSIERKSVIAKEKKPKKADAAAPATALSAVEAVTSKLGDLSVAASAAAGSAAASVASVAEGVKNIAIQGGEAAVAAVSGGEAKKEKPAKEKKAKAPKAPVAPAEGPSPANIDLRVGHILSVAKHPDADSLYVEQVDVGEESPRTIVSGLVNYMSIDEVKDKWIVVVANMKPVAMRGIKSYAMVLCASSAEGKDGGIEFVQPPPNSKPGERIYFEGEKYENVTPLEVLNPKKKVFETIQPGFTTLPSLEAAWVDPKDGTVARIRTKEGYCKVSKFVGASLS